MLFAENDAEGAALAGDTVFEIEAAAVVLVYNASGQRQAETPTTALGGETYFRYIAGGQMKITFRNNFGFMGGAGVIVYDQDMRMMLRGGIKFKSPVFMTWSIYLGDTYSGDRDEDRFDMGGTIGIGFSIGGKLKKVEE